MKYRLNNNFESVETSRKQIGSVRDCKFLKKQNGKVIQREERIEEDEDNRQNNFG